MTLRIYAYIWKHPYKVVWKLMKFYWSEPMTRDVRGNMILGWLAHSFKTVHEVNTLIQGLSYVLLMFNILLCGVSRLLQATVECLPINTELVH